MKILNTKIKGFTLVEMMVTIAVIGILSTIVYANFGSARAGARDDVRKSDLKSLQLAIELYKSQNGQYPLGCGTGYEGTGKRWGGSEASYSASSVESCAGTYIAGLVPDYIAVLPSEVGATKTNLGYIYMTNTARSEYKVLGHHNVEVKMMTGNNDEFARYPSTCSGASYNPLPDAEKNVYAVYSRGAACW